MQTTLQTLLRQSLQEAAQYKQTKVIMQDMYKDLFSEPVMTNEHRIQVLNKYVHQLKLVSSPYLQGLKNRLIRQLQSIITVEVATQVLKPTMQEIEQLDLNAIQSEEFYQSLAAKKQQDQEQRRVLDMYKSYKPPQIKDYRKIVTATDPLMFFLNQNLNQLQKLNKLTRESELSDRRIKSELSKTARDTRKLSTSQSLVRSDFQIVKMSHSIAIPGKPVLD